MGWGQAAKCASVAAGIDSNPVSSNSPTPRRAEPPADAHASPSPAERRTRGAPLSGPLARVERAANVAARRLRLNGAVEAGARWSPLPLLIAVSALAYVKVAPSGEPGPWGRGVIVSCLGLAVLTTVAVVVRAWRTTARAEEGALALDRHHGLEDRLTSALAFGRRLQADAAAPRAASDEELARSFMGLAIADALARAPRLDPRGAVPLRAPAQWGAPLSLILGLGILGALEVRQPAAVIPELAPPPTDRVTLFSDDVELLRGAADELERVTETPEALTNVREFNRLVEDLAAERLDRREAFARLDALEREIRGSGRELESLEQELKALGEELERAALSRPAGEALSAAQLADAEQALRELAERLRRREDPPSKAELEELRRSLERASEVSSAKKDGQGASAERSSLEAERQRLLRKQAEGTATDADRRALERTERQLERLGRRRGGDPGSGEQGQTEPLSELDRKLAEAARELAEAQGKSSDFIDQSADAVGRVQQKQLSQKEKEQLLERMREMRDMLRQQRGGEQQEEWAERMRRLQQKARGQQAGEGEGKPGASAKPGQPSGMTLGPDGRPIPMPGGGQRPGQGGPGEGEQPGGSGSEAGSGHDPGLRGDEASPPQGRTEDVMAVAPDTGEGTASSEVIYSAAQRGFASGEYKRIFTEYETVAEDVIEREGIPPGYRSHVRRYFQLIRPRE